jgi:F-type H+-transporting ATPase subunit beta
MANAGTKSAGAVGTVVQITGPVVDIEFAARELPAIYNAVRVDRADGSLVVEVQQHLGNNRVRSVAMTTTDGLARPRILAHQSPYLLALERLAASSTSSEKPLIRRVT